MKYKAIIWDCDGVLIDSEVLACGAAAAMLGELGYNISLEDYLARFMGQSSKQMYTAIGQETGLNLAENFPHAALNARIKDVFTQSLKATPGMHGTLDAITLPCAVASGSGLDRLHHSLGLTGLSKYFNDHIYSADMVKNGKPAPDIFLLAAEKLGVAPAECLVIEDGIHGTHGAQAAGMDVIAYTGGSHMSPALEQKLRDAKPLAVINNMRDLLPFLSRKREAA